MFAALPLRKVILPLESELDCVFVLLFLYSSIARASFLDSHLEQQTVEAKALKKRGCWLRILTATKEACSTLEPSTQASLALQLLNCHLESMRLEDIRCVEPVTECAAFREIANSPNLLTVYARFYVQVLTTCAFTQLHSEQERLLHIAKNVSESIQQTSADAMKLLEKAGETATQRDRISELQKRTMTTQAEIRETIDSDHISRLQSLLGDLKVFLRASSYDVQIGIESVIVFLVVAVMTSYKFFPRAQNSLILLCVLKFLFERQTLAVILSNDLSAEDLMPLMWLVSRSIFSIVAFRELYVAAPRRSNSRPDYEVIEEQLAEIRARLGLD